MTTIILWILHFIPGMRLRCDDETEILGVDDAELGEVNFDLRPVPFFALNSFSHPYSLHTTMSAWTLKSALASLTVPLALVEPMQTFLHSVLSAVGASLSTAITSPQNVTAAAMVVWRNPRLEMRHCIPNPLP